MEEKLLLQQITFLSRLIGQHKHNNQQRNVNVCNFHRQTFKGRSDSYQHNAKFVNRSHTSVRDANVIQHSGCKSSSQHLSVAPKNNSLNASKYKKININNSKPNVPNGQLLQRKVLEVHSSAKNVVMHPVGLPRTKELGNVQILKSTSIGCSSREDVMVKLGSPAKSSCVADSRIKFEVTQSPAVLTDKSIEEKVSRVHINPQFLEKKGLHCMKERLNSTAPVVHVNPKSFGEKVSVHINPQFLEKKGLHDVKERDNSYPSVPMASVIHVNPKLKKHILNSGHISSHPVPETIVNDSCKPIHESKVVFSSGEMSLVSENLSARKVQDKQKHIFCSKRKLVNIARSKSPYPTAASVKKNVMSSNTKSANLAHRKPVKSSLNNTLMAVSRTKLILVPSRLRRSSIHKIRRSADVKYSATSSSGSCSPVASSKVPRRHVLKLKNTSMNKAPKTCVTTKLSPSMKMARLVCSKYRLRNLPATSNSKPRNSTVVNKAHTISVTKYKIDRRHQKSRRFKKVKKYSLKYENVKNSLPKRSPTSKSKGRIFFPANKFSFSNKVWSSTGFCKPRKIIISHRKLSRIGNSTDPRIRKSEHSSALVRIGGVLYKTSRTKLTRSKTTTTSSMQRKLMAGTIIKKRKRNCGHVVYVRGNKFVMDPLGKTLKRIHDDSSASNNGQPVPVKSNLIKRVDIGGVTFIQKSSDVLMRTNTHNTRSLLSQAKQRSIALLTKKMRKNNQPCMIYHRFGKCTRHEKGTCQLVHDPKHIAICKKFLQGQCKITGCLLSHSVVPEKMPTCKYFLEGCCVRDSCPYLHVKVSAKAAICLKFLQGYCSDGKKCKKRHVYLCPELDQKGTCHKGKYCPYPHRASGKKDKVVSKKAKLSCKTSTDIDTEVKPSRKRYYEDKTPEGENGEEVVGDSVEEIKKLNLVDSSECDNVSQLRQSIDVDEESDDEPRMKRPKLGWLPSYIALESEKDRSEENKV